MECAKTIHIYRTVLYIVRSETCSQLAQAGKDEEVWN